jgi:hypothetical protein
MMPIPTYRAPFAALNERLGIAILQRTATTVQVLYSGVPKSAYRQRYATL